MIRSLVFVALLAFVGAANAGDGLITKSSQYSVSETVDRLEGILKKKGITIFARVQHDKGAKGVGLALRPTELLIFGNPKLGTPLMQSNQLVGIDLPMKAIVYKDDGGKVWLSYNAPSYMAGRHGISDKSKVVKKMTGALNKFTNIATGNK